MTAELRTELFIAISDNRSSRVYRLSRIKEVSEGVAVAWRLAYDAVEGDDVPAGEEVVYQVHQKRNGSATCDCKGHRFHGNVCRHLKALRMARLLKPVQGEE